jgi:hypothetical protein
MDDMSLHSTLAQGQPSEWAGNTYSFIAQAMIFVTGHAMLISLLNLTLFLFLSVSCFHLFRNSRWTILKYLVLFLLLSTQTWCLAVYEIRDSLFTLVALLLILEAIGTANQKKPPAISYLMVVAAGVTMVIGLRPEGIIYAFVWPLVIYFNSDRSRLRLLLPFSLLLALMLTLFLIGPTFLFPDNQLRKDKYETSLLIYTVAWIVRSKGIQELTADELKSLGHYVDIPSMLQPVSVIPVPPDIRLVNEAPSHEDFLEFRNLSLSLIQRNWREWLHFRFLAAAGMANLEGFTVVYGDDSDWVNSSSKSRNAVADGQDRFHYNELRRHQLRFPETIEDVVSKVEGPGIYYTDSIIRVLLMSCLLPLIGFLLWLKRAKTKRIEFYIAAAMIFRLVLLSLIAPAPFFRYVSSFWIAGWLFLFLWFNQLGVE